MKASSLTLPTKKVSNSSLNSDLLHSVLKYIAPPLSGRRPRKANPFVNDLSNMVLDPPKVDFAGVFDI